MKHESSFYKGEQWDNLMIHMLLFWVQRKRKEDPYRKFGPRILYEQTAGGGKQAPTFEPWSLWSENSLLVTMSPLFFSMSSDHYIRSIILQYRWMQSLYENPVSVPVQIIYHTPELVSSVCLFVCFLKWCWWEILLPWLCSLRSNMTNYAVVCLELLLLGRPASFLV